MIERAIDESGATPTEMVWDEKEERGKGDILPLCPAQIRLPTLDSIGPRI